MKRAFLLPHTGYAHAGTLYMGPANPCVHQSLGISPIIRLNPYAFGELSQGRPCKCHKNCLELNCTLPVCSLSKAAGGIAQRTGSHETGRIVIPASETLLRVGRQGQLLNQ